MTTTTWPTVITPRSIPISKMWKCEAKRAGHLRVDWKSPPKIAHTPRIALHPFIAYFIFLRGTVTKWHLMCMYLFITSPPTRKELRASKARVVSDMQQVNSKYHWMSCYRKLSPPRHTTSTFWENAFCAKHRPEDPRTCCQKSSCLFPLKE